MPEETPRADAIAERFSDETIIKADGFDEAIIGYADAFLPSPRIIYSVKRGSWRSW